MGEQHLSDVHLERYVNGIICDVAELKWVESHLYECPDCADRMWSMQESDDSGSAETETPDLYRRDDPLQ
jgi:anti-sigma factor RsiW